MVLVGERVTIIENKLEEEVELKVTMFPTDFVHKIFPISPGSYTEIGATEFCYHQINPQRPATIWVYVNGFHTGDFLLPQDFVSQAKIIIDKDKYGKLKISRIKARWTGFGRIKGLGYIFGRK